MHKQVIGVVMSAEKPRYTQEEDDFIMKNIASGDKEYITRSLPNRSWNGILARARKLGVNRERIVGDYVLQSGSIRRSYTAEEDQYLIENYATAYRSEICDYLGRTWKPITQHAHKKLGLTRPNIRSPKLYTLLESNITNAYWWGFLMADGHFSQSGYLVVSLSVKDEVHLETLVKYLGTGKIARYQETMSTVSIGDKHTINMLKNKLNVSDEGPKTYHPISSLDFLESEEMAMAFFIGMVDGDGSIAYKNDVFKSIRILVFNSWTSVLNELADLIQKPLDRRANVNNNNARGNASLYIGTKDVYNRLVNFIEENEIPVLRRKWYP